MVSSCSLVDPSVLLSSPNISNYPRVSSYSADALNYYPNTSSYYLDPCLFLYLSLCPCPYLSLDLYPGLSCSLGSIENDRRRVSSSPGVANDDDCLDDATEGHPNDEMAEAENESLEHDDDAMETTSDRDGEMMMMMVVNAVVGNLENRSFECSAMREVAAVSVAV